MNYSTRLISIIILNFLLFACASEEEPTMPTTPTVTPNISVLATTVVEIDGGVTTNFEVKASRGDFTEDVTFDYTTKGVSAEPNVDFTTVSGKATIPVGSTSVSIGVDILNDDIREIDEEFILEISNAQNATIVDAFNIATIRDNDASTLGDEEGYNTPTAYYGFNKLFEIDFETGEIDEEIFNFDLGDGCDIDLCGWGNNELQRYTDESNNISITDDKLVITATEDMPGAYRSARLTTKDKLSLKFGRIDIRAKLPKGQGMWPAIWMLGTNIDEVGWPACGEIDIMELVGHQPTAVLGTAHWGAPNNPSTFKTGVFSNGSDFSEEFHVFTLIWEVNEMKWYVDETHFHTIDRDLVGNAEYRFNQDFFFIFNIAVGGNLPGSPDATTVFPQTMEIDYVRVFQEN